MSINHKSNNKVIIIGASAGGAGVAAKLRRLDEDVEIVLFEKSAVVSYATCGIPYYIGNVIAEESKLHILSNEDFSSILAVDLRVETMILSVDRQQKFVVAKNLRSGEIYKETFTKLVLAPGSTPIIAQFNCDSNPNIFYITGQKDTLLIKKYINENNCRTALVVGGGFIGMELVDNLHGLDISVTVLEKSTQVLNNWDHEMISMVHQHLANKNINLILNDSIASVRENTVQLESKRIITADIIIIAIGIKPQTELAKSCDLQIGPTGGVVVNSNLLTSDENIYALGDVAEFTNGFNYEKVLFALAGPTQKQARIVADNLCGVHTLYKHPNTGCIVKVVDLTVAKVGYTEKELINDKIDYLKSYSQSPSNATFYPGAHTLVTKLLYMPVTGKLLGAQIIGAAGVDKRIDVISTALQFKLSVAQLAELDLTYAPPYSTAKDPVNIAGMVANNMLVNQDRIIHWDEINDEVNIQALFIDVRTEVEHEIKTIKGAINIPLEKFRSRLAEIPRDQRIILFCGYGKKAYFALKILINNGYTNAYNLGGGLAIYNYALATGHNSSESESASLVKNNTSGTYFQDEKLDQPLAIVSHRDNYIQREMKQPDVDIHDSQIRHANGSIFEIDACGLTCPGPILQVVKTMKKANTGDLIKVSATDQGFSNDIKTLCEQRGYNLLKFDHESSVIKAVLQKQ